MKALVTGGGGQLGRALNESALPGWSVIAADRAVLDISDGAAVADALDRERPEAILNAAAYTAVDLAETERSAAWQANAVAPGILAQEAAARGLRLVHVSTDFVFDGKRSTPYRPGDAAQPTGAYGETKLAGEKAVLDACPAALVVRASWVYDAVGRNFLTTMLRLMREHRKVRVVADQIGTPTHAASLARAIWAFVASDTAGIIHYADAGTASWYDFAHAIAEEAVAIGLLDAMPDVAPIGTADFPTPARRPAYSVLDRSSGWEVAGVPPHWRVELRSALHRLKDLAR